MKTSQQTSTVVKVEIFLAALMVCCLGVLGIFVAAVYFFRDVGGPLFPVTLTPTPTLVARQKPTQTPSPTVSVSLTPLPGQWTTTPTALPGMATQNSTYTPGPDTVAPTLTLVLPSNTPPPTPVVFLATLTPEADPALRQIQARYQVFQAVFSAFSEYHQQLEADPKLVDNEKWKTELAAILFRLENAASQLAAVKVDDPNYAVYVSYLDQLSAETNYTVTAYRKGLDLFDQASLDVATIHIRALKEVLAKAEQEYKAVKSRLATPAKTLLPSATSTP